MADNEKNFKIDVRITQDEMSAYIIIVSKEEEIALKVEDVLNALKEKGVIYGIDISAIERAVKEKIFNTEVLVAKGKEPVPGKNGDVKFYFDLKREFKPKISEDGRVDFHDLGYITNVLKGQLLAEKIPPTKGIPGYTVKGRIIPAKDGKEPKLFPGKNVVFSEDRNKLFSIIDGSPVLHDGKLSVNPVLEIKGDIGPKTGNIDFLGSLKIYGNVLTGYRVKAQGDIDIEGYVEGAQIHSEGRVLIKGGVKGGGKGIIKALSDVTIKFIENGCIETKGNIYITDSAMHSVLIAGGRIEITGKKGLLVGGKISAYEGIAARIIGSPFATLTEIEVGINPFLNIRLQEAINKIKNTEYELAKVERAILLFEAMKDSGKISQENYSALEKLYKTRDSLKQSLNDINEEKKSLEEEIKKVSSARIVAKEMVYPGVCIKIGNGILRVKDNIERAVFYNKEGSILIEKYI
ncbi:DUF342 domain-containing protein [Thermovenabulum sp.]|uniref:DUF342 domain-containing protein n=1 Tax=Thermovenabulum sp. TaxID=3100335 RepID=UPI003C7D3290